MRYAWIVLAVALVAFFAVAPASAQTKWVRGTVVSTGPDTVTVKVGESDMTFKVEKDTQLIAKGAGTAAHAPGAEGVKFTDFVKPGEGVEVHYKQQGDTMIADVIRAGVTVRPDAPRAQVRGSSVHGKVTELTGNSVSVQSEGKDWKFSVTPKTLVRGHGLGTKSEQMTEAGKGPSVKDLLHLNDVVVVDYVQQGEEMTAREIHVITPAPGTGK